MANPLVGILNDAQSTARDALRAARSAVSIGVVTAVDPTSQTISVTPVGGHQPIDGVAPFQVESPIGVGTEANPTLVRLYKHGGAYFAAPIETDVDARIGKDTRVEFLESVQRVVDYDGARRASIVRTISGNDVFISASQGEGLIYSDGGIFADPKNHVRTVLRPTRVQSSLVDMTSTAAFELDYLYPPSMLIYGEGHLLPPYCYDSDATIDEIYSPIGISSTPIIWHWIVQPTSGMRTLVVLDPGGLLSTYSFGIRLSDGASVRVEWNPESGMESTDPTTTGGTYRNPTPQHAITISPSVGTFNTLGLHGRLIADIRALSAGGYERVYDVMALVQTVDSLRSPETLYNRIRLLVDGWSDFRRRI